MANQSNPPTPLAHPTQPMYLDEHGTLRFKANALIRYLFEAGLLDLNRLAAIDFPAEDRAQIAQLLGYSLSGYGELSYITDDLYERAETLGAPLLATLGDQG